MSVTPLKTAFYGMFSSGVNLMGYALYISLCLVQVSPLVCGRFLADLDSSHVERRIIGYTYLCLFLRLLPRAYRRLPPWHDSPYDDVGNPVYEILQYANVIDEPRC